MALVGSRAIVVGLALVAGACGAHDSTDSPTDATSPSIPVTSTVVGSAPTVAATSVVPSIAPTEAHEAVAVSQALESAKVRWSEAGIASYRLTVAEDGNYWSQGCRWITVISDGVLTVTEVDPSSTSSGCDPVDWTVEQLHEMIAGWLEAVDEFAGPEFGEHTIAVQFDDLGVPVAMEFDLANGNDEESSMRVTLTRITED